MLALATNPLSDTLASLSALPADLGSNLITLAVAGVVGRMAWYLMTTRVRAKRTSAQWRGMQR